MIQISKDEAMKLRREMPNAPIRRTVHKYYAEESPLVMRLLGRVPPRKDVKRPC